MRKGLLTPSMIAERGVTVDVPVRDYDWLRQQRWDENMPVAGSFTGNSIQTFDNSGKPSDSRSDSND